MVEQAEQQISVAEFLSVAIFLAEESGKVIRHVEQTGFEALKKGDDSPVTEADIRV
jgi:3'-phosphoadenosine 5'-phosphosulfate (PAPS) 3'-phosphatase